MAHDEIHGQILQIWSFLNIGNIQFLNEIWGFVP